jgi:hypothetical protein
MPDSPTFPIGTQAALIDGQRSFAFFAAYVCRRQADLNRWPAVGMPAKRNATNRHCQQNRRMRTTVVSVLPLPEAFATFSCWVRIPDFHSENPFIRSLPVGAVGVIR